VSKRAVTDCDMCGAIAVKDPVSFCIWSGRQRLPTGEEEDTHVDVDLCPACAKVWLISLTSVAPSSALILYKEKRKST
jgi:hypothetical protein